MTSASGSPSSGSASSGSTSSGSPSSGSTSSGSLSSGSTSSGSLSSGPNFSGCSLPPPEVCVAAAGASPRRDDALEPLRELELLSPWFDASSPSQALQPPIEGLRRWLLLLAPPRSGSFHLCRLLWQLGYGRPTEYLNPNPLYRSILSRWGRLGSRAWLRTLIRERSARSCFSGTAFFALKLQPHQERGSLQQLLRRRFAPPHEQLGLEPGPPLVLQLRRRDLAAAMASLHFSRCTGAFDLGLVTTHQGLPIARLLDPAAIASSIAEYRDHLRWLEQAAGQLPTRLCLDLEDLVADQAGCLRRLVQAIEPHAVPPPDDPRLALRLRRDASPFASERRLWLDRITVEVRRQLAAADR